MLARGGLARAPAPLLRARNLVLRRPPAVPFAVGARSEGRFLFLVPWEGRTLVGTSYEPAEAPPSDPLAFLDEAAPRLPLGGDRPGRTRPWSTRASSPAAAAPRAWRPGRGLHDHEAEDGLPGLVSLQGVKYTTARAVAERAVDLALRRLGRSAPRLPHRRSPRSRGPGRSRAPSRSARATRSARRWP